MTPPNYNVFRDRAPVAISLTACACVLVAGCLAWPYTVDDAFITARYAQNLARGLGYGMNPFEPSDGVTAPLWLVPQIVAVWLGLDPIAIAKGVGLGCAVLAAGLVLHRLRRRACGRASVPIAALLLATAPSLATWGAAGLETGLAALLFTAAALCATRARGVPPLGLGASIGALAWLRPELALASAALLAYALLRERRAGAIALSTALACALALLAFRVALFSDPLPLSIRAKPASLVHGAHYAAVALWLATTLVGAWLCFQGGRRGHGRDRALLLALVAHLLAIALAGGDWMPGYRLLVPVLPVYALLASLGAVHRFRGKPRALALCVGFACALPALDLVTRIPELRQNAGHRAALKPLARALGALGGPVALLDVGYLGYAGGMPVIDLGGLTDPLIARMPGGHLDKRIDASYLRARAPRAFVLHSARPPRVGAAGVLQALAGYPVERRVAAMRFVREQYRVRQVIDYAPGYYYVVLGRIAEPAPAQDKGENAAFVR